MGIGCDRDRYCSELGCDGWPVVAWFEPGQGQNNKCCFLAGISENLMDFMENKVNWCVSFGVWDGAGWRYSGCICMNRNEIDLLSLHDVTLVKEVQTVGSLATICFVRFCPVR